MRLLCGASESVVNSAVSPAILSRTLVAFGSTAETMIALTPAAARLSISVCCDATVACVGVFKLHLVVRQFVLRLLHARAGSLPEVGRAVGDERQRRLVGGLGGGRKGKEGACGDARENETLHHVSSNAAVRLVWLMRLSPSGGADSVPAARNPVKGILHTIILMAEPRRAPGGIAENQKRQRFRRGSVPKRG